MSGNRFAWERAVMASDLPPMTRLVLFAVGAHMDNRTRQASVSQKAIATATGIAPRTVRKHLAGAVDAGWLDRTRRGFRAGDDTRIPSTYVGTFPRTTGTTVPVEDVSTGTDGPVETESVPAPDAPVPARDDTCTGTTVPTITLDHSEHCGSGERFDDIDLEVHKQIKAKKDRGEPIRNERALRRSIREDVIAQRELDRLLDEHDSAPSDHDRAIEAARALGRNLAGVEFTEEGLHAAYRNGGDLLVCRPGLFYDETVPAWQERANELQERSA